jgi:hypothetical protein
MFIRTPEGKILDVEIDHYSTYWWLKYKIEIPKKKICVKYKKCQTKHGNLENVIIHQEMDS